jgi:hypothetical protein
MAVQQYTSAFQSTARTLGGFQLRENLNDLVNPLGNPSKSGGAQQLDQIQLVPPATTTWTLLGITVTADIAFSNAQPVYGKFGKVLAGLVLGQAQGPQQAALQMPLPSNQGGLGALWDPAVDPLPPSNPSTGGILPALPVTMQITLPQPIPIYQGELICAGLFMLPSLLGSANLAGLIVCDAGYTVTYDDGLTPTSRLAG